MKLITLLFLLPFCLVAQDIPASRVNGQYAELRYATYKATVLKYFQDLDGDGYGNKLIFKKRDHVPAGYVLDSTDCNDGSASIHPGAAELCNGLDDDCSGLPEGGVCDVIYMENTGRLLEKDLFGGDLEDCWFKGGDNNMIDIFGDPYFFPRLKSIGFTSIWYGNGSYNHAYQVDPDTAQDGMFCGPWVQEGNVKDVCDDYFGVDLYRLSVQMADSLDVPLNIAYNAEYGDTVQLAYMIEQGHPTAVQECVECNNWPNSYTTAVTFPDGGISYRNKMDSTVNKYLDAHYPDIKKGGDNNPLHKLTGWDTTVLGGNWDMFRLYLFESMYLDKNNGNTFPQYLASINSGIEINLPAKLDSFRILFPGYYLGLFEVGLNNSDPKPWNNTMLANLNLVKFYRKVIEYNLGNNDLISVMVYKSIRSLSLSKQTPKNHLLGLKQIGQVFKGDTVVLVNSTIPGVYGMASIGPEGMTILMANDNDYESAFTFDGFTPTSAHAVWGDSLNDITIHEEDVEANTVLKRNSITIFK